MRTRSEYLIQKRDGRLQGLRATKLARSLQRALAGGEPGGSASVGCELVGGDLGGADLVGGDAELLACELAEAILRAIGAVRRRERERGVSSCAGTPGPRFRISAVQLAEVSAGALRQCGHADAAERYLAHRARRAARRSRRLTLSAERSAWSIAVPPVVRER